MASKLSYVKSRLDTSSSEGGSSETCGVSPYTSNDNPIKTDNDDEEESTSHRKMIEEVGSFLDKTLPDPEFRQYFVDVSSAILRDTPSTSIL